jgi:hypothetical protein
MPNPSHFSIFIETIFSEKGTARIRGCQARSRNFSGDRFAWRRNIFGEEAVCVVTFGGLDKLRAFWRRPDALALRGRFYLVDPYERYVNPLNGGDPPTRLKEARRREPIHHARRDA